MVWHGCARICQPGALSSPTSKLRRLTAGVNTSSVSTGCVGHTSVLSDSGSRASGSVRCARVVLSSSHGELLLRALTIGSALRIGCADGVLFFPESGVVFSHTHFSAFLCIHMYFCAFYCIFKALGRAAFYKSVTF